MLLLAPESHEVEWLRSDPSSKRSIKCSVCVCTWYERSYKQSMIEPNFTRPQFVLRQMTLTTLCSDEGTTLETSANKLFTAFNISTSTSRWCILRFTATPTHLTGTRAPSTRIRIFLNPQLFRCGLASRPHVSGEYGWWIRNFLKTLPRVDFFEYAVNTASCGRSNPYIFEYADVTVSDPVFSARDISTWRPTDMLLLRCYLDFFQA